MTAATTPRRIDKPVVDFNLDTWESENAAEPFSVVVGGKRYVLEHPDYMDYRDLLRLQSMQTTAPVQEVAEAMGLLVPEKDRDAFMASRMPAGAFMAMLAAYAEHFGMTASGEVSASPS